MLRAVLILIFAAAGSAAATPEYILPTLFDVARVAADDVLNIHAAPEAGAPVIGTLAPDATAIEVVEERQGWARIHVGGQSGWVSSRYLDYRTNVWTEGALPPSFRCLGTEPFWSLSASGDRLVLERAGLPDRPGSLEAVLTTGAFRDPTRAAVAEGMTLSAVPHICSDGMSDRTYGMRALLVLHDAPPAMLSGCCSVQP